MKLFFASIFILANVLTGAAQIASGGSYTLDKSVIASGGGTSSDQTGALYIVNGTIGQSAAGAIASGGTYSLTSGFQIAAPLGTTAGGVTISGRVITPQDFGLTNAFVTLTDLRGNLRTVRTGTRGAFRFADVAAGETYVLTVQSKRYTFAPQIITANEDLTQVNFTAIY